MSRKMCFLLMVIPVIWVSPAGSAAITPQDQIDSLMHPVLHSKPALQGRMEGGYGNDATAAGYRRINIGSRPPNCKHKCGGCRPCIPIQIPTNTDTNYEPEVWKCKCGSSLFHP